MVITPLLMDTLSLGSPWMAHSRICSGLPILSERLKPSEQGISLSLHLENDGERVSRMMCTYMRSVFNGTLLGDDDLGGGGGDTSASAARGPSCPSG